MRAVQFCKIDIIRCRSQLWVLGVFTLVAFYLASVTLQGSFFSIVYMIFGAVIIASQPFNIEQEEEAGFIHMLPGSKGDRVMGRFLFSLGLIVYGVLAGMLIAAVMNHSKESFVQAYAGIFAGAAAAGLLVVSLQNILFYAIGKGKSKQMMSIIRMLPAFAAFFGGFTLIDKMKEQPDLSSARWIMDHADTVSFGALAIAAVVFVLGIMISTMLIQKRDFN